MTTQHWKNWFGVTTTFEMIAIVSNNHMLDNVGVQLNKLI